MGQFGFSYIGFLFLTMLMVPNLIWTKHKPQGYGDKHENKVLLLLERLGQACVTSVALVFSDFNLKPWSAWTIWLIAAFALMMLYECWWIRYFHSEKTLRDFYSSFLGVPVAGATLPLAAFFLLGIYGKVVWMPLSVVILAIGHIGIHLQHRNELQA